METDAPGIAGSSSRERSRLRMSEDVLDSGVDFAGKFRTKSGLTTVVVIDGFVQLRLRFRKASSCRVAGTQRGRAEDLKIAGENARPKRPCKWKSAIRFTITSRACLSARLRFSETDRRASAAIVSKPESPLSRPSCGMFSTSILLKSRTPPTFRVFAR